MSKKIVSHPDIRTVWMVTREYDGLAGAGGVKDVCRQLSEALANDGGCRVCVVLPRYGFMNPLSEGFSRLTFPAPAKKEKHPATADRLEIDMDYADERRREDVSFWFREKAGVSLFLVEADRFSEKLGIYTYTESEEKERSWQKKGAGHFDYFAVNVLLQKAALALMLALGEKPDVIHCQDGHAALIPAMIREQEGYRHFFRNTGTVVTIHNAGSGYHQEVEDLYFAQAVTGLPDKVVRSALLNRAFDPFLVASGYAVMNTVSEQYARELQETEDDSRTGWLGHALLVRNINLGGITNGINPDDFDPTKPKKTGLPEAFDVRKSRLKGKKKCKEFLLRSLNSRRKRSKVTQFGRLSLSSEQPLYTFIGRLTHQKGVDLLVESFTELLQEDKEFKLLVLGSGDPYLEAGLQDMAEKEEFNGQVCFLLGYDQELASKIYAAGDFFLVPSLFEPCGLTDYIAQLFGNIPVVHHVGGLVKVIDGKTGLVYEEHSAEALTEAVRRSLSLYRSDIKQVRRIQKNAVQQIYEKHSWKKVMRHYLDLYRSSVNLIEPAPKGDKKA